MLNAHSYPITALNFSDDGKMLATYAYGDSTLSIWLVSFYIVNYTVVMLMFIFQCTYNLASYEFVLPSIK